MRIKTNREGALADDVPPDEHLKWTDPRCGEFHYLSTLYD